MLPHRPLICAGLLAVVAGTATVAAPSSARGEIIELLDKTKMSGKIIHYYDGVYSIETNNQTIKLPREKIRAITFQLPPPTATGSPSNRRRCENGNSGTSFL